MQPTADGQGTRDTGTALRKFVDGMPILALPGGLSLDGSGTAVANNLGQYLPVAVADKTSFSGSDYYEIAVVEYREQLHSDLPATGTLLRGYVQIDPAATDAHANPVLNNGAIAPAGSQAIALVNPDGTPVMISRPDGKGGFVQTQAYGVDKPHYLGPVIVANRGTPPGSSSITL